MKKLICLLFAGIFICRFSADAQKTTIAGRNIIKFTLSSIAISHYAVQYERITTKRQSFAIGFGISPKVDLPFKQTLLDQFDGNDDARNAIESTVFTKVTVTPEYRFYLSKGAPNGFYVAPFARYSNMTIDQNYRFTPSSGRLHNANMKGKMTGFGGGLLIGAQWSLGTKVTLDWWIAGPFIGGMDANFHATDDMSDMSAQDKADLEGDIESVDIPLWKVDATVGANTIDAKVTGPFVGVRVFGISLGYRF